MLRYSNIFLALSVIFGTVVPNTSFASDKLREAWQNRATTAKARLAGKGLDTCDKAYESAFANPIESTSNGHPSFDLRFNIGDKQMRVVYEFDGVKPDKFILVSLPPRWLAYQDANSKTLSVVVAEASCAFDLCTNDPFADGSCTK